MTHVTDSRVVIQARIAESQRQGHYREYQQPNFLSGIAKEQKMRKRSQIDGLVLPEFGLLAVWLLFYGLLVVHGLTTSYAQRLAKAWTVEDSAEGSPGAVKAVRTSLSLSADTIAY